MALDSNYGDINQKRNPTKKVSDNNRDKKSHPLLSFLALRWKKKTTARSEFARYLEYLKEGGMHQNNHLRKEARETKLSQQEDMLHD
ncbi:hypothetical protein JHK85_045990 [Glycine max]|nr:hypothetical protein JHK85_045990 [Glycine max]